MDDDIDVLISGNLCKAEIALKSFIEKKTQVFAFPELEQQDKRNKLWLSLFNFIQNPEAANIHCLCLAAIRILSREKLSLNELITGDRLELLLQHAHLKEDIHVYPYDHSVCAEALKCLCNLIFNSRVAAAISSKNGTLDGIIRRLKTYKDPQLSDDIKMFDMRLLFLITALCSEVRPKLKEDMHGLTYLIETLDLIIKESTHEPGHNADIDLVATQEQYLSDTQVEITCEILKVLFNITVRVDITAAVDEEEEAYYLRLVSILHDLFVIPVHNREKELKLHNHITDLLTNMPNSCYKSLYIPVLDDQNLPKRFQYDGYNMKAVYQFLELLKSKFEEDITIKNENEVLSPILTVLQKCVSSERLLRKYIRLQILPPLRDVHHRPEQGNTLRNCMCRLLTTPLTNVRDLTADILFILCKENVGRMIKYSGYGNAAGLLATRGLLGGGPSVGECKYSSDSEDSDTEEYREHKHGINPVVGCYEAPRPSPMANMTEEQKEYEAMKLVDLMDNLTRQGIVQPCRIGEDGRPEPIEHVLQLQESLPAQQVHRNNDDD